MSELAETSRRAYRALVHDDPAFAAFFRSVTPIAELSDLRLGSRPAARGRAEDFGFFLLPNQGLCRPGPRPPLRP
jgi:phosphoenolpyruvate carboxylase